MNINVLRIVSNLGGGGVQRRLVSLLPHLDKRFKIYVCSFEDGPLRKVLTDNGYETFIIPRKFKFDPLCITRLIGLIKSRHIQIVHTHTHKPNTTGRIAAILSSLPARTWQAKAPIIIANEHNVDEWKSSFQLLIDRMLANFTDKIVCVSQAVRQFYRSIGIPPEKLCIIYNGVDLEKFKYTSRNDSKRKELSIDQNTCVIGTIGRLHPQKGYRFLIEAAGKLVRENPRLQFLIIGKGYLKEELVKKVESLNLEKHFLFLGEREDIPLLLSCLDIFVLPSLREGFPNTILEAMASSLPVVATNVGGVGEIVVSGKTGFLVPPRDVSQLYSALRRLINDEKLRRTMGRRGYKRVKNFSIDRMAEETENLYLKLLEEKKWLLH